jgi:HSP20 family protein
MKSDKLPVLLNNHRDYFGLTPFDSLFDKMIQDAFPEFGKTFGLGLDSFNRSSYPKVNIEEKDSEYVITAELAGLKKEEVSVDLDEVDDSITISGGKSEKSDNKNSKYLVRELKQSSFKRTFVLGDNVDKDSINADFVDGILTVVVKKKSIEPPKQTKRKIL